MKIPKKAGISTNFRSVTFLGWKLNTGQLGIPDEKRKVLRF